MERRIMIDDYPELLKPWYIVCQSNQLRTKPLARTLLGQPLVLFRSQAGRATAFVDRCPHRNAPLSAGWVKAGNLICPYNGWQFNAGGDCHLVPGLVASAEASPALARRVGTYPVMEQEGLIWVFPGPSPSAPPRHF